MGSKQNVQTGAIVGGMIIGAVIGGPMGGWEGAMIGASLGGMVGSVGGGIAGGMMYPPPKPETKIRLIKSAVGTSAVEGVAVTVIFGRTRIGANMMHKSEIVRHESTQVVSSSRGGGKGGGGGGDGGTTETTTTTTWFTADFVMALGEGPLKLHKIYEGKNVVDIAHTFYPGSFTQEADTSLTNKTGKAIGYRGTSYVVFNDYNLGSSSSIPALTFEVESALYALGLSSGRTDAETNHLSWNPGVATSNGLGSSLIQGGYLKYNNRDYIPGWTTYSGSDTAGLIYNRTDNTYNNFESIGGVNIVGSGAYIACSTLAVTNSYDSINIKFFEGDLNYVGNEKPIDTWSGSLPLDSTQNTVSMTEKFTFVNSPIGYTTQPIEIDIPDYAYECVVTPNTRIDISTDANMSTYDKVYPFSKDTFPCGRLDKIYVRADDSVWQYQPAGVGALGGTVSFRWNVLSHSGNDILLGLGGGKGVVSQTELYWNGTSYDALDEIIVREEDITLVAMRYSFDTGFFDVWARTHNYKTPSDFGSTNQIAGFPVGTTHAWAQVARIPEEDIKEVSFFEYENVFVALLSNGNVYRVSVSLSEDYRTGTGLIGPWKTIDNASSYLKVNTNDLETDFTPQIGSVSRIGAIIYVGYTNGTASVNTGKIKYYDLITNSWSDVLYSTAAVVNKNPSALQSQTTNTYHVPLHHDNRTLYFGKNDSSNLDKWKIYKTRDNFVNTSSIESYEHYGTGLYEHDDYMIRILGVPSTVSELGSETFNDIVYSYGAVESYSIAGTTHELITTAEVIDDIITSNRYGGNFNGVTNFPKAKQDCIDNGYYINVPVTEKSDLSGLLGTLASHGWVSVIFSGSGIKLLVSKNEDIIATISENHLVGTGTDQSLRIEETGNSERVNRLEIEFTDPEKAYSSRPIMVEDIADQEAIGIDKTSISLPGFVDKEVVKHVGNIMLRNSLYGRRKFSFTLGPEHLDLEVGDPIQLHFPNANINWLRSRITNIEEREDFNLGFMCREEPDYIFDTVSYTVPSSLAVPDKPYNIGLSNVVGFNVKETPYELLTDTGVLEMAVLYGKASPDNIGIDLYYSTDDGISYGLLLQSRHNPPVGILKTAMDQDFWLDSQTIEVDITGLSGSDFVSSTRNEMFSGINSLVIDDEYMMVQNCNLASTNTYELSNFIRGRHGTATTVHPVGATVYQMKTVDHFTLGKGKIGTNLYYKAVPVNLFKNELDISDVPALSQKVLGRAHRPHPPSSVQLVNNDGKLRRSSSGRTTETDLKIKWQLVNKQTGYGRQGFGYAVKEGTPLGEEYVDIIVENWFNNQLVRTTIVGNTMTNNTYTELENKVDNGVLSSPIEFRVYSRGAYGRSITYTPLTVTILGATNIA